MLNGPPAARLPKGLRHRREIDMRFCNLLLSAGLLFAGTTASAQSLSIKASVIGVQGKVFAL
jgi:hypothetical protein